MKIIGIMVVKNEGDIIRHTLTANRKSFDRILVLDNGSTDQTWDVVKEIAANDHGIVAFARTEEPFRDSLRSRVFNAHRNEAKPGDWWCRLDADEVYLDDPRAFLAKVPTHHHVVWSIHLQFYLTASDLVRFPVQNGPPPEMQESHLPHHYRCNFSEARFFRHRNNLVWGDTSWPSRMGVVTPKRIKVCHYQYRSPQQISLRLTTRKAAAASGWEHFKKDENKTTWRDALVDATTLQRFDEIEGVIVDPELFVAVESWSRRLIKAVYYRLFCNS